MTPESLLQAMTPEIYERLRQSVETGKWLDGEPLSTQQQETCMQAIIMYQSRVMASKEHMTVNEHGEIVHLSKRELKEQFNPQQDIARFSQDDF
ncbi:YeaC family protein [Planctobacterium marinum]|uniref:Transcriptional regulator n=1 Tax=Planctobacterium marinum TaxID=1631968 RepID=A0AA48HLY4_9ALTE|nr:transcriptional regulator [Planctobacterium marinum]